MTKDKTDVKAILQDFQRWMKLRDRSAHSIRAYLSDLRQFMVWFSQHIGEPFRLDAVTEYEVSDWRDTLADTMKPATVNRKLVALSSLYRWAVEQKRVIKDPTRYVNGVKQQRLTSKALPERDMRRILRQMRLEGSKRDAALLELLAATGLRASELAALNIQDLELHERSGWVLVNMGKGRKQRRVPVHAKARRILNEYLETLENTDQEAPLFTTQKGSQMTPYTVWYTVKKYARLAKVEKVSPHTFRHTVAT